MRVSSVMLPASSCGTLRSARMKTRSAGDLALGTEIGEAKDVHGVIASDKTCHSKSAGRRGVTNRVRGAGAGRRPCLPRWSAARCAARSTASAPTGAANRRASCQVPTSCPPSITTSGATTPANAATGAYCSARSAQPGRAHGRSRMKKKQRVSTVTPARPTMTARVHRSVRAAHAGLSDAGGIFFSSQKLAPTAMAIATTIFSFRGKRIRGHRCRARDQSRKPPQRRIRQRAQNPDQAQHAGETQAPGRGDQVAQRDAGDAGSHPADPGHEVVAREVGLLLAVLGLVGSRPGEPPREHRVAHVGREVAVDQPAPARHVHQVGPQVQAEHHEAQVHAKAGRQYHPGRRARDDQRDRRELGTARVHQEGHGKRLDHAHAGLDHGHAGHQAPGARCRWPAAPCCGPPP